MRTRPYSVIGIKRLYCFRCKKNKARFQWEMRSCAKGGRKQYYPLCIDCDVMLNEVVLRFMGFSNYKQLIDDYVAKILADL